MFRFKSFCLKLAHQLAGCALCFAVWSLWLLLLVTLAIQVWVASSHEVTLPMPLLHFVERRLSTPNYQVTLGRVAFDPSGHLLVQGVEIVLPGFDGPVVRAVQIQTRLDPWGLLAGHPEAHQFEITGAQLLYPSQLSPTGRSEPLVDNLEAALHFEGNRIDIDELSAKAGPIALFAHGSVDRAPLRNTSTGASGRFDAAQAVSAFVAFVRKAAKITPRFDALQGARIDLTLFPSPIAGALVDVEASASHLHLDSPHLIDIGPFRATTRFPLAGAVSGRVIVQASLTSLTLPEGSTGKLEARFTASWNPHTRDFAAQALNLAATQIKAHGVEVNTLLVRAQPAPLPGVTFEAEASVAGAQLGLHGTLIPAQKSGHFAFEAVAGSGLEQLVSQTIHKDLSHFVIFSQPGRASGTVDLLPGGKLGGAEAWVDVHHIVSHEVPLDWIAGHVTFDGHTFLADHAVVIQGQNLARGSYEMDVATHDFRFLLAGFLRPIQIGGWFKPWWPQLWSNFHFPAAVPAANVDVQGRWHFPLLTTVFVGVDADGPVVKGVPFEHASTRVYVHSHDVYALYIDARRKEGSVRGWFSRTFDPQKMEWSTIDFDMTTKVNLAECAGMFHSVGPALLAPYTFERPPEIHASGHIDGPAAAGGPGEDIAFQVHSTGAFAFHGFPFQDVSFTGTMKNRDVAVEHLRAGFAKGKAEANLTVTPEGKRHRVTIEASLKDARLGDIIRNVEDYAAKSQKKSGLPRASTEERMSNARLDATVKAEGFMDDSTSFHGMGTAQLTGPELGQVRLMGGLSELVRFTSLRFTSAATTFKLAGPDIDFQTVRVTGHNSAIDAHGTYSIKTKALDFKAKVWPFEQSDGLVRGTFGLVLSPLTVFLEVKLGGTLSQPSWSFVYSPFHMLTNPEAGDLPAAPTQAKPVPEAPKSK